MTGEYGDLEGLHRELRMITDSEEEIDLITDGSRSWYRCNTDVLQIVHEGVNQKTKIWYF